MRRLAALVTLLVLAACGDDAILPGGGPRDVAFRAISERQNPGLCVHGPQFALALSAEEWKQAWTRSTECQPAPPEAPPLLVSEAGIVAWWKTEGCLGYSIKTTRLYTNGRVVTVSADEGESPGEFCATAIGGLESFLAVNALAVRGAETVRFLLDGTEIGSVPVPH
jgi:hypothetical protein